jgi:hypothetical protein
MGRYRFHRDVDGKMMQFDSATIVDFGGIHEIASLDDLEFFMQNQYGEGYNEFWIYLGEEKSPALSVLTKKEIAVAYYFPEDRHPGFASMGSDASEGKESSQIEFRIGNIDGKVGVPDYFTIPIEKAISAAKEFIKSGVMPQNMDWLEL